MALSRARRLAGVGGLATLVVGGLVATVITAQSAQAATGCKVTYTVASQWPGGFGANVELTNLGDPLTSWTVTWSFAAGQTVTQGWNATVSQSGTNVQATSSGWNGAVATNGTASFGFNGSWTGSNPVPTAFALNGTTCTGGVTATTAPTTTPTTAPTTTPTTTPTTAPTTAPPTTNPPASGAIYVAPTGSATAAGTIDAPTTLVDAITKVAAGGTIYLRGGTYALSTTQTIAVGNNGTASARKTISAYQSEKPVLDFSAMAEADANRGLAVNGNYWRVYGITVQHAGDNGIFIGGSNNIIERVVTAFNHDSGLQISRAASTTAQADWPANNLVLSSESHDNADSDGEDADGFAAKLTSGPGNVFRYTVSHNNIDDGWDLYAKTDTGPIGVVTIEDSLSYNNGTLSNGTVNANGDRNGYKLGGSDIAVNHVVRRSIAVKNGHHGFTYNSNPGAMQISSNLSIDNAERNFSFDEGTHTFTGNTSCRYASGGSNDKTVGTVGANNQFWTGTNGSRCTNYSGALAWSFASDGKLNVTLGGKAVVLQ